MRYSTEPREQYEVLRFVLRLLGSRCFFLGGRLTEIPFQPSTCGSSLLKDSILWAAQNCFQIPQSDNLSFDFFLTTCNPLPLSQRKRWILNWGVIYRQWNKIHTEVDSSISFQECLCHDPPPHLSKGHLHSWYLSVCCVHCDPSILHPLNGNLWVSSVLAVLVPVDLSFVPYWIYLYLSIKHQDMFQLCPHVPMATLIPWNSL